MKENSRNNNPTDSIFFLLVGCGRYKGAKFMIFWLIFTGLGASRSTWRGSTAQLGKHANDIPCLHVSSSYPKGSPVNETHSSFLQALVVPYSVAIGMYLYAFISYLYLMVFNSHEFVAAITIFSNSANGFCQLVCVSRCKEPNDCSI